jgi:hypothetical protein
LTGQFAGEEKNLFPPNVDTEDAQLAAAVSADVASLDITQGDDSVREVDFDVFNESDSGYAPSAVVDLPLTIVEPEDASSRVSGSTRLHVPMADTLSVKEGQTEEGKQTEEG